MTRPLRLFVGALLVVGTAMIAAPAYTAPTHVCTPDSSFCTDFAYAVNDASTGHPTTVAATPTNLSLDVSNTSSAVATDMNLWWKTLSLTAGTAGSSAPVVATSAAMPANLLVAGTRAGISTCTAPFDSTKCPAGWGTARVDITGTPGGFADGIYSGSFGIAFIRNDGTHADATHPLALVAELRLHFDSQGFFPGADITTDQPIQPQVTSSSGVASLTSISIPVTKSGTQTVSNVSANYDASLESIHLAFRGTSNETTTATLPSSTTVVTAPRRCGTDSATVSATDRAAASISQPESITFVGCPTMKSIAGKAPAQPFVASFTANATSGLRAIDHYMWTFGDGTAVTSRTPQVTHTFAGRGSAAASVVAIDALGARSASMKAQLRRTTTTGSQVMPRRIAGRTSASSGGLAGRVVALRRCATIRTPFLSCRVVASHQLSTGSWSFSIPRPQATVHYAVVLPGMGATVGSAVRINATPRG